ncbi:hypothetical protein AAMO2058_000923500, partial [Amorphochlora amoebiformis]
MRIAVVRHKPLKHGPRNQPLPSNLPPGQTLSIGDAIAKATETAKRLAKENVKLEAKIRRARGEATRLLTKKSPPRPSVTKGGQGRFKVIKKVFTPPKSQKDGDGKEDFWSSTTPAPLPPSKTLKKKKKPPPPPTIPKGTPLRNSTPQKKSKLHSPPPPRKKKVDPILARIAKKLTHPSPSPRKPKNYQIPRKKSAKLEEGKPPNSNPLSASSTQPNTRASHRSNSSPNLNQSHRSSPNPNQSHRSSPNPNQSHRSSPNPTSAMKGVNRYSRVKREGTSVYPVFPKSEKGGGGGAT